MDNWQHHLVYNPVCFGFDWEADEDEFYRPRWGKINFRLNEDYEIKPDVLPINKMLVRLERPFIMEKGGHSKYIGEVCWNLCWDNPFVFRPNSFPIAYISNLDLSWIEGYSVHPWFKEMNIGNE